MDNNIIVVHKFLDDVSMDIITEIFFYEKLPKGPQNFKEIKKNQQKIMRFVCLFLLSMKLNFYGDDFSEKHEITANLIK